MIFLPHYMWAENNKDFYQAYILEPCVQKCSLELSEILRQI